MPSENSTEESRGGSAARTRAGPVTGTPHALTGGLTPATVTGGADTREVHIPLSVKLVAPMSVVVPTLVG